MTMRSYIEVVNQLNEIELSTDYAITVNTALLSEVWANSTLVKADALQSFDLRESRTPDRIVFSFIDPSQKEPSMPEINRLVACVRLDHDGKYWVIRRTFVEESVRRKGLMRFLIHHAVQTLGPITSDDVQSPDAQEMWKALIASDKILKLSRLDLDTGTKLRLNRLPAGAYVPNPWEDNDRRFVILAEDKRLNWTADQAAKYARDDLLRESLGRIPNWYGPSGNDDWPNP